MIIIKPPERATKETNGDTEKEPITPLLPSKPAVRSSISASAYLEDLLFPLLFLLFPDFILFMHRTDADLLLFFFILLL